METQWFASSSTADNGRKLEYGASLEWPGLLSQLEREEPDYRT